MRLRDDERAVTVQIGAVLLLGFVVISMSMYQATVVPQQNEDIEYAHNQQVHEEFVTLRGNVVESATESAARPTAVTLGTRYPSRTFFVNPAPASGTLRSRSLGRLTVSNVSAVGSGDAGDYVAGDNLSFATNALEYRPNYTVFQSAPTTVYESTVAYNRFENGYNGTLAGQSLVSGRTISLVVLEGNYTKRGVRAVSVDARATSPATRTVAVTNDSSGRNVTVTVPTELSADDWRAILRESGDYDPDRAGDESDGAFVYAVSDAGAGAVRIVMERNATYDLRVGAVGVGTGRDDPASHYMVGVRNSESNLAQEGTRLFTFEVRDRYNNPVSGETVNVSLRSGSGELVADGTNGTALTRLRTDEEGRVTVEYRPDGAGSVDIGASFDSDPAGGSFDASSRPDVRAAFAVYETGSGGDSGGGGGNGGDDGSGGTAPTTAYASAFTDGDGTTEPHEDDSIPTQDGPFGNVENFQRSTSDDGDRMKVETEYVNTGIEQTIDVGTRIDGVESGSSYTLELDYFFENGNAGRVDVLIVDERGNELQSHRLDQSQTRSSTNGDPPETEIALGSRAQRYVDDNGRIYVEFETPGSQTSYAQFLVDYVRVRSE